ncbi:hypothetical protein [Paraburkholderia sacchari]|uniref:Uncharacterized protein n=1 Tax=Paraburkholderia sacchari TaxID=159450 RepID=A0A8T6ZBP5_9BURK|nr:hypothetical protein [Paraburkholderia sacchari]NLP62577.1 hypothetical protein [Paraburkholderia sacchari]
MDRELIIHRIAFRLDHRRAATKFVASGKPPFAAIVGGDALGGKTHHVPCSCRKKKTVSASLAHDALTPTYRVLSARVQLNRVSRTGPSETGPSHFSTCERKELLRMPISFS